MDEFDTTDPVEGDALPVVEIEGEELPSDAEDGSAAAEVWADGAPVYPNDAFEPSPDDDDVDEAEAEDDEERYEEIERDGKRAKIPAWLKPELMMQADYTRKTQELAEARRSFESEREAAQGFSQAEYLAHGNLAMIDRQIAQFSNIDFNVLNSIDPAKAQQAYAHFQQLQQARQTTAGQLGEMQHHRTAEAERESDARVDSALAELARDVPGWSPETANKLFEFGQRHYGFSADDLEGLDDARAIKALQAAYQWEEHQAKVRQAKRHAAAQGVKPAARLGGGAPRSGLDDRLSTEEWVRRRNGKLRKRR